MTIKMTISVESIHETAKVVVERIRQGERAPFHSEFVTSTSVASPTIDVEVGDEIRVSVQAGHKIVYDSNQFTVGVEELPPPVHTKAAEVAPKARHTKEA